MNYCYFSTIGQDSHAFLLDSQPGTIKLAGIDVPCNHVISANSDGDVLLHALTNAISGATGRNILGSVADKLCLEQKITDSRAYLQLALDDFSKIEGASIVHLSISIECLTPKLSPHIDSMKQNLSNLLNISTNQIGITATTGEGLTGFGRGLGVQVLVILSCRRLIAD